MRRTAPPDSVDKQSLISDSANLGTGDATSLSTVALFSPLSDSNSTPSNASSEQVHLTPEHPLDARDGLTIDASETLSGSGEVQGRVNVAGTLSPGNSPGFVDANDLTLESGSTTVIELGGLAPGSEFDQIRVIGTAELGGTLEVRLINGFTPSPGDAFEIFQYGSSTGAFDGVTGLDIGGGLSLVPVHRDGKFLLVTTSVVGGAESLLGAIQTELQKFIDGVSVGDLSLKRDSMDLGGFLQLFDLNLDFTGISVQNGAISGGSVTLKSRAALLLPGKDNYAVLTDGSDADAFAVSGSFDPVAGTVSLIVDQLDLAVSGVFRASADLVNFTYSVSGASNQTVVAVASASIVLEVLDDTRASIAGLRIRTDGFEVASATATVGAVSWAGVFELSNLDVAITGLNFSTTTGALEGGMALSADSIKLFESVGAANSSVTGFSGSYNFGTRALSLSADSFDLALGSLVAVHAQKLDFVLDPVADTFSVSTETASLDVAGFVSVSGSFGFQSRNGEILAVGNSVTVRLAATADVYVEASGVDFGLIAGPGKLVFELQAGVGGTAIAAGALDIHLGDFANVTAKEVFVQYSSGLLGTVTGGDKVEIGGVTHTFSQDIALGTVAFAVVGLDADVGGVFQLSGDMGFSRSILGVLAVGNDVTVRLEVDPTVYVELAGASFGLIARPDTFGFELKDGTLNVALGPLADVQASSVFVQYTSSTTTITGGTRISVGPVTYTFVSTLVADTIAFEALGFSATVLGSSLTADRLAFRKAGLSLTLTGVNVGVSLKAGETRIVSVSGADFQFVVDASGFYGALRNAAIQGPDFGSNFTLKGSAGFRINTTGEIRSVTLGSDVIQLGGGGSYLRVEVGEVPGENVGDAPEPAT